MAKNTLNDAGIRALFNSDAMEQALRHLAEPVQDEAVRITAAEAVDTGLMAASWRLTTWRAGGAWRVRIYNKATAGEARRLKGLTHGLDDDYAYPLSIEFGYFNRRANRHIAGRRILGRALASQLR